jgi:hypothetical protein
MIFSWSSSSRAFSGRADHVSASLGRRVAEAEDGQLDGCEHLEVVAVVDQIRDVPSTVQIGLDRFDYAVASGALVRVERDRIGVVDPVERRLRRRGQSREPP